MMRSGVSIAITKKQIQYIQSLRRRLGIDDDTYAAMKASVGVGSTRELDNRRFDALIQRMNRAGMGMQQTDGDALQETPGTASEKHKASGIRRRPAPGKRAVLSKIHAILAEIGRDEAYADGIARHMFNVDKLAWCDATQTFRVLQALAVYQRRHGSKDGANVKGDSNRNDNKEGQG